MIQTRVPPASGFSLIELLVVVAILSAVSLLAFGSFTEDRTQIRYEDTRQRLQTLYRAILGRHGPSTSEMAAGFVADNGDLPSDLATLLQIGTLDARLVRSPIFDPRPNDTTCENDGGADEIALVASTPVSTPNVLAPAAQLVKGHVGDYLGGMAVNGRFRDGWGNVSSTDDALNFGWKVLSDGVNKTLAITSLGLDNAESGLEFAADFGASIAANDWLIPISGWTVQVKNLTASDINASVGSLSVSLLVYVNTPGGGKWRRYATASLSCLDAYGAAGDGQCDGAPASSTATATFHDGCKPGSIVTGLGRIPQGRHLLVISHNGGDNTPWTTDDKVTWGSSPLMGPYLAQVDVVAGRSLPFVTLEIR